MTRDNKYNQISTLIRKSDGDDSLLDALESFIQVYKEERNKEENPNIPLSLFSDKDLGVLEALIKCLKENFSLKYSKIAKVLKRNDRTIWASYNKAAHKHKDKIILKQSQYQVPVRIFADRRLGPLEALVIYLKDNLNLKFKEISKLLNRDYRTIWLSYHNGIKKRN